jgi:cell wall-associated NlpC family hydrolase
MLPARTRFTKSPGQTLLHTATPTRHRHRRRRHPFPPVAGCSSASLRARQSNGSLPNKNTNNNSSSSNNNNNNTRMRRIAKSTNFSASFRATRQSRARRRRGVHLARLARRQATRRGTAGHCPALHPALHPPARRVLMPGHRPCRASPQCRCRRLAPCCRLRRTRGSRSPSRAWTRRRGSGSSVFPRHRFTRIWTRRSHCPLNLPVGSG